MKNSILAATMLAGAVVLLLTPTVLSVQDGSWRALFNGEDLDGWTELKCDHIFEARTA